MSKPLNFVERQMLDHVTDGCVSWLKAQGLEVLKVQKGPVLPLITIRNSKLCEKFEGAVRVFENGPKGKKRYRFVTRFGCEVRWMEEGGEA